MGVSKTWKQGPDWQANNTVGGQKPKVSKGGGVKAEGTHMSDGGSGRKGIRSGARMKSRSGHKSTRPGTVYG